jgi:hypothetical protein
VRSGAQIAMFHHDDEPAAPGRVRLGDGSQALRRGSRARTRAASAAHALFQEILDSYPNKLPSVSSIAHRLETQQKFNPGPAKSAASVLEKSLRFAGVLDSSNNILPVRDAGAAAADEHEHELDNRRSRNGRHEDHREDALGPGTLSVEIPVAEERTVVIRYPHDLSAEEATKVGNVLAAIVG